MRRRARARGRSVVRGAAALLLCGSLAGLMVAATLYPLVAAPGLVIGAAGPGAAALPGYLVTYEPPQASRIFAADGKTQLATFYDQFRTDVPLADISPNMQNAIVAAEDRDFYHHHGVDLRGVVRAFVKDRGGGARQGASTLTMQYVRMVREAAATSPQSIVAASRDTLSRKVTEMRYALEVEKRLSKGAILERYLNLAPFGNNAYGVDAASAVYFHTSPRTLTVGQAALLAGMVKAPSGFNPATADGYPRAVQRRRYVVDAMVKTGAISQAEADRALAEPVPRHISAPANGCLASAAKQSGFFCDYFYRWWLSQPAFGTNSWQREQRLRDGGYRIVTTMDLETTRSAYRRIGERISTRNPDALMLAAVEPGTGHVLALAANRRFGIDDSAHPVNELSSDPAKRAAGVRGNRPYTVNPIITGGGQVAGYQAGSTFKLFTLVAALEKGLPLRTTITAGRRARTHYVVDPGSPAACPGTHFYCPGNAGESEAGRYTMWSAFGHSVNTYFVPLEERVGAQNVVDVAKRFGIQFRAPSDAAIADDSRAARQWGAFTLGVSASTPLDVAGAYATLAADGRQCAPTPVATITSPNGTTIATAPDCHQATTPDVARAALDAARCPVGDKAQLGSCGGRGTAPQAHRVVGHPVFGKTGTADDQRTAALVLGTASLVVAGYLADPDWPRTNRHMSHAVVNPAVWNTVADVMRGRPEVPFPRPGTVTSTAEGAASDVHRRSPTPGTAGRRNWNLAGPAPAGAVHQTWS
ncbi:penicillin-binding protein [Couchioplanes caeruleus]|uniref:transglycosylase domain-containing protein n=1 Tax=Couchioplanes caeruleus TaxID=56438 RepID=UPI0020BFC2E9|nr:transglycosylase domain-containing protein [Couchioplanes caeruleus]UQU67613.1 penicillin-binding protein [Couchioplanes caeruleus]